jgi:hypothetical protein
MQVVQANFDAWDFHLHNIILNGIHVDGISHFYSDLRTARIDRFRRLNFNFFGCRYDTIYRGKDETPYSILNNTLHYTGHALRDLPFEQIFSQRDDWGSERNWWFKRIPTLDDYYDLRLNPINACANLKYRAGSDGLLSGCVFCHRAYGAERSSEIRKVVSPAAMFDDIFRQHGRDVLTRVSKVMLVTGDLKDEAAMLDLIRTIYFAHLRPNGFRGVFSAVTTLIRSERGIRALAEVDNSIFEYPIECFSRRDIILGAKKGDRLDSVIKTLEVAKRHFQNVRINYLVGLDDINSAREGFNLLVRSNSVDDIIPNIFVPPTGAAMRYRQRESFSMSYIYEMRKVIEELGFRPHRISATKDLYSHFAKQNQEDEFAPSLRLCGPV